ncbi:MAG: AmmeMemoRadiSam system radical SAM enzyme [candidate division Zixibacteria bacterium]|nr:AmmeMemoRadiSam system radical SAM enzyme [candidate division Zixibacteria bacterium]
MIIPAAYSEKLADGKVRCWLCPAECLLTEGKVGICRTRFNRGGTLVTENYGELVTGAYDPIEKKPLYHFHPGSVIFSTGANGCNFKCANCQNWDISQTKVPTRYVEPDELVELAAGRNSIGIAYTYSEPLIWFEYIRAAGRLIHEAGLKNVLVSNGYINPEPLEELLPIIDAANIDLKAMNEDFYKRICKGKQAPVVHTISRLYEYGTHIEVTNLVIPGRNDTSDDFERLTDFIAGLSPRIPLHFSAYYPTYRMTNPPTPLETLESAYEIAKKKLDYVFLGNVHLTDKADTRCPSCGAVVISRRGYRINPAGLRNGICIACGYDTGIH